MHNMPDTGSWDKIGNIIRTPLHTQLTYSSRLSIQSSLFPNTCNCSANSINPYLQCCVGGGNAEDPPPKPAAGGGGARAQTAATPAAEPAAAAAPAAPAAAPPSPEQARRRRRKVKSLPVQELDADITNEELRSLHLMFDDRAELCGLSGPTADASLDSPPELSDPESEAEPCFSDFLRACGLKDDKVNDYMKFYSNNKGEKDG